MLREESDQIHCKNLLVKETPVRSKRTKTNREMTPEKYYAVHLVSRVLPLNATTDFAHLIVAEMTPEIYTGSYQLASNQLFDCLANHFSPRSEAGKLLSMVLISTL